MLILSSTGTKVTVGVFEEVGLDEEGLLEEGLLEEGLLEEGSAGSEQDTKVNKTRTILRTRESTFFIILTPYLIKPDGRYIFFVFISILHTEYLCKGLVNMNSLDLLLINLGQK